MKVAVKHINKALFSSQDLYVIRQECEILRTCNHPNVVRIYDCIEDDQNLTMIMELIEGETLANFMLKVNNNPITS